MKKEIAEQWVAELRSGKHQQGTEYLHRADGSKCCLGVLAGMITSSEEISTNAGGSVAYHHNSKWLAYALQMRAGISTGGECSINFEIEGEPYCSLADANDNGCTFAQIADVIEQRWEEL